ncbi:MAG: hypothetical protein FWE40_05430 [Oscillospiraceae bacterium]|nr:hypothetical protein [Oscillospiraceae bacterium]
MDRTEYVRLLSKEHKGIIVRCVGRKQYQYDAKNGWVPSGILLAYFWPDDPYYEMYEEITEQEALALTA